MLRDQTTDDIMELRIEAASARQLAATFDDGCTVRDLLNYADALDREAGRLESACREIPPRPRSSCTLPFEIAGPAMVARPSTRARFN
jgi:hypothetical protein